MFNARRLLRHQGWIQSSCAASLVLLANAANGQTTPSEVVVTGGRANLLGVAISASQGSVTQKELELRPIYRVGQLLESTPGLVVTVHSGEGKANQYFLRGFNLDHGTDIANFVDDMPINRPTNTHGQGYADLNFLIPQVAQGLDFTKGPYYADIGDFGAVASTRLHLANAVPNQISFSAGTLGVANALLAGIEQLGAQDRLVGAAYLGHVDGPFTHPDNFRKIAGMLRYSHGSNADGYSLTAMYFHALGNLTTDQPLRAIQDGLIGRYGTLDPSDGSRSERISLSGHYGVTDDQWSFSSSAYYIHSRMTLWNDFTHLLDDPINGDQEEQTEDRSTAGGQAAYRRRLKFGAIENDLTVGVQGRYDDAYLDRRHTKQRAILSYCELSQADGPALSTPAINLACNADRVHLGDVGLYLNNTTRWSGWLRTVLGIREEFYCADDHSFTTGFRGSASQTLFQPKGSIIVGPWRQTEIYLSAGRGFHSDDVRGVFGTVGIEGEPSAAGRTPLLAPATGEEIGVRTNIIPRLSLQIALFQEDFDSELAYDADAGQDSASAPSRRRGVELSGQYKPFHWLSVSSDLSFAKARYRGDLAAFGLAKPFISSAPGFIGSLGVLVDDLGSWFGGLQWRDLGPYPVEDGEKDPQDKGYSEVNVDVGYKVNAQLKLQLSIFNLFDSHANSAAYDYAARLPGEPAQGVDDFQVHPLEPISAVLNATWLF